MSGDKIVVHIDIDLEDLIPGFLENRHKDLQNLKIAVQENDSDSLKAIGHNLKGVGGGYGFQGITEIGAKIEESAKVNNLEEASGSIKKLGDYLANLEIVYLET